MVTMVDPGQHDESDGCERDLSRAERLVSLLAAAGMSECSAWMIPALEPGGPDEDPGTEKEKMSVEQFPSPCAPGKRGGPKLS